jgi:hypothetical protein
LTSAYSTQLPIVPQRVGGEAALLVRFDRVLTVQPHNLCLLAKHSSTIHTEEMAASRSADAREPTRARRAGRVRMSGAERREQLIAIGRTLFADRGFEGTAVEEVRPGSGQQACGL